MATVSEQIVTGRKFRKLIDEATKLWQRISFWTKASDVEFDDGSTAETKMGAINGITDSLVSTSSNVAASAKALSQLNNNLMSGLGGNKLIYNESEDAYYIQHGADAALKKLGSTVLPLLGLDYTGGWACMTFSVTDILKLDEFKLTAKGVGVYYQLTDDHALTPDYVSSKTSRFNNQFTVNVEVDILSICSSSTKKYFKIVTSALLYGADHPFEISVC